MSDDLREEIERPQTIQKPWYEAKVAKLCIVSFSLFILCSGCFLVHEYGTELLGRAISASWDFVIERPPLSFLAAALLWILGVIGESGWRQIVNQLAQLKRPRVLFKSLWVPAAALLLVFLFHLFIWTPAKMYQEKERKLATAVETNTTLKQQSDTIVEQLQQEQRITKQQASTISSLQSENSKQQSKLADYEAKHDKSAAAVIRAATNFCYQVNEFLAERERGESRDFSGGVYYEPSDDGQRYPYKDGKLLTEAELRALRQTSSDAYLGYHNETYTKFFNKFALRLVALRDDFAGIGIGSERLNKRLDSPEGFSSFSSSWVRKEMLAIITQMTAQAGKDSN